ncbi:Transposase MuDR plant [Arabidopsis suecica]|uniref:Transposase MuDR plant n=1 Tax=Arabidopsis suecica TaxID=45249 RepID=A0A8T2BTR2_ARASU|nr:Transposase MuDR plant [Arabidopsis suecica]
MHIYVRSGVWRLYNKKEWRFIIDEKNRGRLLSLETTTTFEELQAIVAEDYGIEQSTVDVELSYLPTDLSLDCPPVVMMNNRQEPDAASNGDDDVNVDDGDDDVNVDNILSSWGVKETRKNADSFKTPKNAIVGHGLGSSSQYSCVSQGQYFRSKELLQSTMELYAMKYNCDYRITKSDTKLWCIRCIDVGCKWRLRAERLERSSYLKINKYVGNHTCAPSKKSKFCRTPSAKTIGHIIMHNYEGVGVS